MKLELLFIRINIPAHCKPSGVDFCDAVSCREKSIDIQCVVVDSISSLDFAGVISFSLCSSCFVFHRCAALFQASSLRESFQLVNVFMRRQ